MRNRNRSVDKMISWWTLKLVLLALMGLSWAEEKSCFKHPDLIEANRTVCPGKESYKILVFHVL